MTDNSNLGGGESLQDQTSGLFKLPAELIIGILSFLDVHDVIAVRKTCRLIYQLSEVKSIWLNMLVAQRSNIPLPMPYDGHTTQVASLLDSDALERLVFSNLRIERSWLRTRAAPITLHVQSSLADAEMSKDGGKTVLLMEVFADRWLLTIYNERWLNIWDLRVDSITPVSTFRQAGLTPNLKCRLSYPIPGETFLSSACAALDENSMTLVVAAVVLSECIFISIQLPSVRAVTPESDSSVVISSVQTRQLPKSALTVRALHTTSRLAFFSYLDSLYVIHWDSGKWWNLNTDRHGDEELWNGVIAARFLSSRHILCVKTHALELLTLPHYTNEDPAHAQTEHYADRATAVPVPFMPIRVTQRVLSGMTYRGVSMSLPETTSTSQEDSSGYTRVRISFLAYDILRGLFQYRVIVLLPDSGDSREVWCAPPPHMSVRLLAVHRLAQLVTPFGEGAASTSVPRPRSGFTPGSRGFVSACILGRTGKRGVWIERRRASMRRSVLGFKTAPDTYDDTEDPLDLLHTQAESGGRDSSDSDAEETLQDETWYAEVQSINGQTMYEVNSYDLRDDITHCAFSEATGSIILGTRSGELKVL